MLAKRYAGVMSVMTSMLLGGEALATNCPQGMAIYEDQSSSLRLEFTSLRQDIAVMHHFSIATMSSELQFTGYVLESGEPVRPFGIVQNNCPEGDVTGEELAACTVWEGVIYGTSSDGMLDILPNAEQAALPQLLLPDFSHSLLQNEVWAKLDTGQEPMEIFKFVDCGTS